jgi:hypothetical protein
MMINEIPNNINTFYPCPIILRAKSLQNIGKQFGKRIDGDHLFYQLPHFFPDLFDIMTGLEEKNSMDKTF